MSEAVRAGGDDQVTPLGSLPGVHCSDTRVFASVAASTRVAGPVFGVVRYGGVWNGSSLAGGDAPVDRRFARRLVSVGAEVRS